jgi:hypothetical protein
MLGGPLPSLAPKKIRHCCHLLQTQAPEPESGTWRNPANEVLTRQCSCLGLSIHGAYVGAWRIRRLQTETGGAHEFTQGVHILLV